MTSVFPPQNNSAWGAARGLGMKNFKTAEMHNMVMEMFGRPNGPGGLSEADLTRNLTPNDVLGPYLGRSMELVSAALTAAVLNDRASILQALVPLLETLETSFSVQYKEANQVPYSRVTNYGIPREFTYSEWEESYSTQRKKQMTRIEKNLLLDPNYGMPYWNMMLRTLGTNAKLTINLEIASQLIEVPYLNQFGDMRSRNRIDHNVLFNAEQADFAIAQRDQDVFFQCLIRNKPGRPVVQFNTIVGPEGVFARLKENAIEGGPMPTERVEYSEETRAIQSVLFNGPSSTKRVQIGGRTIDLVEIGALRCNMRDSTEMIFKPMETITTYAEVIPFECGTGTQRWVRPLADRNNVFCYSQTPTSGRDQELEFANALDHTFLFDTKTGEPSALYRSFLTKLNNHLAASPENHPPQWKDKWDINDESAYGVDRYDPATVRDKTNLKEIHGFRDDFPFFTYDPQLKQWRMPLHQGDMHQNQLTNARIAQGARLILATLPESEWNTAVYNEMVDFVTSIRRSPWDQDFALALIKANPEYVGEGGSRIEEPFRRHKSDKVGQFTPNEFGSLKLPQFREGGGAFSQTYPPGFGSYSGIQTLASEADKEGSPWLRVGMQARVVLSHLERLHTVLSQYTPNSELVDGRNTAPWFHVEDEGRSVLLDTLVQMKTGETRPGPVFLAVSGVEMAEDAIKFSGEEKDFLTFAKVLKKRIDNDGKSEGLTAEITGITAANGRFDEWMSLGSKLTVEDLSLLSVIANDITQIGITKEIKSQLQDVNGKKSTVTTAGDSAARELTKHLVQNIQSGSLADNASLLVRLYEIREATRKTHAKDLEGEKKTDAEKVFIGQLAGAYVTVIREHGKIPGEPPSKSKSLTPAISPSYFLTRTPKKADNPAINFLRAPLESSSQLISFSKANKDKALVRPADPSTSYTTILGVDNENAAPPAAVSVLDIASFPSALNANLSLSSQTPSSTSTWDRASDSFETGREEHLGGNLYGEDDAASRLSRMLASAGGFSFGAQEDVQTAASHATTRDPYGRMGEPIRRGPYDEEETKSFADGMESLFGPWKSRLEWLRKNLSNGIERTVALAILLSRNNLFTHKALSNVGGVLMRMDGWRTGVQVETAALVRMIRGSSTAFHALARITLVPSLEGVTGDMIVTAEFFHGTVFTQRQNIDILSNAVLRGFRCGKGHDFMDSPTNMLLPPVESQSILVMPDSENANRIDYPRHLLNESFYYQSALTPPSPYRKHQYAEWANHIIGPRAGAISRAYHSKAHYWNHVQRSLAGNRAFTRHMSGESGQFTNWQQGTGATGSRQLNIDDAWEAYNGHSAMPIAIMRSSPN